MTSTRNSNSKSKMISRRRGLRRRRRIVDTLRSRRRANEDSAMIWDWNNIRSAGFTLIELMIAMAIASIVTVVMYVSFESQVRGQVSQDVSLSMTQSVRAAMEIIASDIRMARCDPTEMANAEIVIANSNNLVLTMDIGGGPQGEPDGDTNDANERVQYTINEDGDLARATGIGGVLEPLHSTDLACDALNFVYLDANGNPMTPLPLSANRRSDIRFIEVSIVVRSADATNPSLLRQQTDNRSYVNLQGAEILPPPGDTFRRFQLSTTIACRN